MRYLLVTGGVISGLGKGITASSLGVLLQTHGCTVTAIKIDPYLNQDSGTISPFEHGECFVLEDGGEVDLDLGSYERFLGIKLTKDNNITTGKVYKKVLEAERRGDYLGATVQIVPHITDAIIEWIQKVGESSKCDVCIIELGGTVGDIESLPFLEALRQMIFSNHSNEWCHVHVSYIPVLKTTNELKTKPTQESIKKVRGYGLNPDFLCLRCEQPINDSIIQKVQKMCGITTSRVLKNIDVSNIYHVPLYFSSIIGEMWKVLNLDDKPQSGEKWEEWKRISSEFEKDYPSIKVAIIGKYSGLKDSYLSLSHAIKHAAVHLKRTAHIDLIESSNFIKNTNLSTLKEYGVVIIPGGFGVRGVMGMIEVVRYVRENNIPTLGICLGMQIMIIEWCGSVCGLKANSTEFDPTTPDPVLIVMDEQEKKLGGTMRLGKERVYLEPDSKVENIYQSIITDERHRHRYEVNPDYHCYFKYPIDLRISGWAGLALGGKRVEIIEHTTHPFYIGCQFHPEYQTYPTKPHPLFVHLLKSVLSKK